VGGRGDRRRRLRAAADRGFRAIVGNILAKHATSAQKERWRRGIGAGTTKIAFAITEADAGSNSHNLTTSLRRENGRFLLSGQKTFISGVEDADAVLVVARTRTADGKLGLPSLAIVDVDAPGFTRQQIEMASVELTSSGSCSLTTSSLRRSG
jgi:alkylation response protein AidB-like acyl-CoA dehydrogenase